MKEQLRKIITVFLSISGYVPHHATVLRTLSILISLAFVYYISEFQSENPQLSAAYFVISTLLYIGFIFLVLPENGLRHWFISRYGEERGYRVYEAILSVLFFHSGASVGYVSLTTSGEIFRSLNQDLLFWLALIISGVGLTVKVWSAKVVGVDIYYWKDMFLGRKITSFAVEGPYKYLSNPMYGIGQLQAYGVAIMFGSAKGLIAALIYQCAIFIFYHSAEKNFIQRVYLSKNRAALSTEKI